MTSTLDMSKSEWLALRRTGIGGSDAAAAIGLSPYTTPFRLWQEKRGEVEPDDLDDPQHPSYQRVRFGKLLEPVIAEEYVRRTGNAVRRVNAVLRHKTYPFMLANLDRKVVGKPRILEIKTVDKDAARFAEEVWGEDGTDEVPTPYMLQVQHYLAITGAEGADFPALIGGNDLRIYKIERDESIITMLARMEGAFWDCVERGEPPMPRSTDEARERWPKAYERAVEATPEVATALADYRRFKAEEKTIKAALEGPALIIANHLAECNTLMVNGRKALTYNSTESNRVDMDVLKTAYPEVYASCLRKSESRRMLLK